jgi:hypothetical protein
MMSDDTQGFADQLSRRAKEVFEKANPAVSRLLTLAQALKMNTAAEHLAASREGLRRPTFTMIVFGRFKNGKSTLLNVLLGRLARPIDELPQKFGAPLPVDDLPASARVTTIRYGEEPSVTVAYKDGRRKERSVKWFLENSALKTTEAENITAFGDIEEFELIYPFENGKAGIILVDTPGTDEAPDRTGAALRALNQADAAIVLLTTAALGGEGELKFAEDMIKRGLKSYFIVVNRINGRKVDERLKVLTWDKVVRGLKKGPTYSGGSFADQRVYFVDALAALDGRLANDDARTDGSGIIEFEQALAQFYEKERRRVHVERWTGQAVGQADRMLDFVGKQIPMLKLEREEAQRLFEDAEPKMADLAKRKIHLARIFRQFRERAVDALQNGFHALVLDMADDMPKALANEEITSIAGIKNKLVAAVSKAKQKEIADEAATLATAYFERRVAEWEGAEPPAQGARLILEPRMDELMSDLKDEVNKTERDFRSLRLQVSGRLSTDAKSAGEPTGEWWARIAPAAVGLIFGPDMAVMGASNGWKGFGKSLLVHTGVIGGLALILGPLGWGALIAGWLISYFGRALWNGHDMQSEVKKNTIDAFTAGMREQITSSRPSLEKAIDDMMRPFAGAVTKAFGEEIDEEIQSMRMAQQRNGLSRDEKDKLIAEYGKIQLEMKAQRDVLEYVMNTVAMV